MEGQDQQNQPQPPAAPAGPPVTPGGDGVLRDLLRELVQTTTARQEAERRRQGESTLRVKPPTFNGEGDVEWFLLQLQDVAEIGRWSDREYMLKLREVLSGRAQDCARGETRGAIVESLRLRFGVTRSEARKRVAVLKRDPKHSLHEHAGEVRRLTRIAWAGAEADVLEATACESFLASVGHVGVQRHLLAMRLPSLEDNVRAAEEYIGAAPTRMERVAVVEDEEAEVAKKPQSSPAATVAAATADPMQGLVEVMQRLEARLGRLEEGRRQGSGRGRGARRGVAGNRTSPRGACFACGETGHFAAACPRVPRDSAEKPSSN